MLSKSLLSHFLHLLQPWINQERISSRQCLNTNCMIGWLSKRRISTRRSISQIPNLLNHAGILAPLAMLSHSSHAIIIIQYCRLMITPKVPSNNNIAGRKPVRWIKYSGEKYPDLRRKDNCRQPLLPPPLCLLLLPLILLLQTIQIGNLIPIDHLQIIPQMH